MPATENLSASEAEQRVREIFAPYHGAIARHLDARAKAKRPTTLISLHSFTPVYGGVARPWQIGELYNRHDALADALLALLREQLVPGISPSATTSLTPWTTKPITPSPCMAKRAASACGD